MNSTRTYSYKKSILSVCTVIMGISLFSIPSAATSPKVVVSVLPIHSLVQSVMDGVGDVDLLIDQGASPHGYSLKPSQVRTLNRADLVVWVGESLETFLEKPLSQKTESTAVLELMDLEGMVLLENRVYSSWDEKKLDDHEDHASHVDDDGHEDEDHAGHEDENHADHIDDDGHEGEDHADHADRDGHEGEDHADHADHDGHKDEEHHDHGRFDPHIWLSIENSRLIVKTVGAELSKIDPDNAQIYQQNVESTLASLNVLKHDISKQLSPVKSKPYLVFHDGYQYFEKEFSLNSVGAVTINPERKPGAKRLVDLRERIKTSGAVCIFSEPQFKPAIVNVLSEGLPIKRGELDPMGSKFKKDKDAYFKLLNGLSLSIHNCLAD